jgi:uncharacterized protein YndB with AHSA1/START domain
MVPGIEREVVIEAPVEVVWRTVTEPDQIVQWFSDTAEIDVRPGGEGTLTFVDRATHEPTTTRLTVERVDPHRTFAFRWSYPEGTRPGVGNSVLVEFTLTAEGVHTRLRVVERGLAELDWPAERKASYAEGHNKGWVTHLDRLREYVVGERQPSVG